MSTGKIKQEVEIYYQELVKRHSDINEHLPTLKRYAEKCNHITEMGVRSVVSTFAFVMASPKKLISIDISHPKKFGGEENLNKIINFSKENGIDFQFIEASTLNIEIEKTDFLFIDTWHCYEQLRQELNIHSKNVNKYIGFHDTTLYEFSDESYHEDISNSGKHGLWPAIEEFLSSNSDWVIKERYTNNNGLTILEKIR